MTSPHKPRTTREDRNAAMPALESIVLSRDEPGMLRRLNEIMIKALKDAEDLEAILEEIGKIKRWDEFGAPRGQLQRYMGYNQCLNQINTIIAKHTERGEG